MSSYISYLNKPKHLEMIHYVPKSAKVKHASLDAQFPANPMNLDWRPFRWQMKGGHWEPGRPAAPSQTPSSVMKNRSWGPGRGRPTRQGDGGGGGGSGGGPPLSVQVGPALRQRGGGGGTVRICVSGDSWWWADEGLDRRTTRPECSSWLAEYLLRSGWYS